jgi:hypothetical protein
MNDVFQVGYAASRAQSEGFRRSASLIVAIS